MWFSIAMLVHQRVPPKSPKWGSKAATHWWLGHFKWEKILMCHDLSRVSIHVLLVFEPSKSENLRRLASSPPSSALLNWQISLTPPCCVAGMSLGSDSHPPSYLGGSIYQLLSHCHAWWLLEGIWWGFIAVPNMESKPSDDLYKLVTKASFC